MILHDFLTDSSIRAMDCFWIAIALSRTTKFAQIPLFNSLGASVHKSAVDSWIGQESAFRNLRLLRCDLIEMISALDSARIEDRECPRLQ
jgi:hypothetical protein